MGKEIHELCIIKKQGPWHFFGTFFLPILYGDQQLCLLVGLVRDIGWVCSVACMIKVAQYVTPHNSSRFADKLLYSQSDPMKGLLVSYGLWSCG